MKLVILLSVLLLSQQAIAAAKFVGPLPKEKRIKIAVIDTGIADYLANNGKLLCKTGSKDFTHTGLNDTHGHGTNVVGLIDQYAKDMPMDEGFTEQQILNVDADFCFIVLKYFDPRAPGQDNLKNEILALKHAISMNVDIINFSGGGTEKSEQESALIRQALDKKIIVVVAAGNEYTNIDGCLLYTSDAADE